MDQEKKIELYLRGYEEGQKEAWSKIKHMVSRYDGWELKSRIESRLGTLYQDVKAKKVDLREDPSPLFFEEPEKEREKVIDDLDVDLNNGEGLLVIEENLGDSIEKFKKLISEERKGLFISRDSPDKILRRFDFGSNVSFIWLSKSSKKDFSDFDYEISTVSPSNLQKLSSFIGTFLKSNDEGVIFISGIQSIINFTSFSKLQRFIGWTMDNVSEKNGFLICSIPDSSIKEKRLGILKAEFDIFV
ncbi:MAG: DUF835 domain-containing protein [Thermoplasmatota archaeon]